MKFYACLEVINWAVSLGGEHFSGEIVGYRDNDYHRHEVNHPLTAKEALSLNKKDESRGCSLYKKGMISERFWTQKQLERAAVEQYKHIFPNAKALFEGFFGVAGAQRCLDGPKTFKTRMNELYEERVRVGGYERDPDRTEKIDDEAWEMMKGLTPGVKKGKKKT